MTESIIDEADLLTELSPDERDALTLFTAAQRLLENLPTRESMPVLGELEHDILIDRLRGLAHDLREAAGQRGAQLWASVQ